MSAASALRYRMRPGNWRLSIRLVVAMLCLSIGALSVTGLITSEITRTRLVDEISGQLTTLSALQGERIGSNLAGQINLTQANVAIAPDVISALRESNARYEGTPGSIETALLELDAEWRAAASADGHSPLITSVIENPIGDRLRSFVDVFPAHAEVFITDRYGAEIAGTGLTSDYYQADEDWWQAGWNEGQGAVAIGSPVFDESAGIVAVEITVPVYDPDSSEVIGIIKTVYDITAVVESVSIFRLGETGETLVIDSEGNFVADEHLDHIGDPVSEDLVIDELVVIGTGFVLDATTTSDEDIVLGFAAVTTNGDIPEIDTLGWSVIITQSHDEAFAVLADMQRTIMLVLLAIVVVAVAVALVLARSLTQGLTHLTQVATRIAQGDLTQSANIPTRDEIGLLSSAFNQMTRRLVYSISSLDQKVNEVNEANKALQVAGAQLQEKARLKSEFMATMSHELRTPLNAMLGFTGIMLTGMGGEIDDDARHMVERIEANSRRLLGLINEVLDLAKIEAGRMELVTSSFSPHQLVEKWKAEMDVLAEQKGLSFETVVDPALPGMLYGDAERITQIAVNLLSNAFKFTESGGVTLNLRPNADVWEIRVSDTGIGIPKHALNFIFDEFRQIDGSSTRVYGGSGLGLAIVRNLALMMGGNVRADSTLGQGSVFTVTLPLVAEHLEAREFETA